MDNSREETKRMIQVYGQRDASGAKDLYSWELPINRYYEYRHRAAMAAQLSRTGFTRLHESKVLDVGCGDGSWLRTLSEWGCEPENLYGTEILSDRISKAEQLNAGINYKRVSSHQLPFADEHFDIVTANVVFSSILDESYRQNLATEMQRVCKRKGIMLIYDFKISDPRNSHNVGIGRSEMSKLFRGYRVKSKRLLLFPPLARPISKISILAVHALEVLVPVLCSHTIFSISREAR